MITVNAAARRDPTRTTMLRAEYVKAMRKRFMTVKKLINLSVVDNDALMLSNTPAKTLPVLLKANADAARNADAAVRYDFPSDPAGKADAFMDWLNGAMDSEILEISEVDGARTGRNPWQNTYIRSAYGRGVDQATNALRQAGAEIGDYALAAVLNAPQHAGVLALMYTRNYNELKGVTDEMGKQIARALADGLAQGLGPREVARLMADRVDKIGITRAELIARTEIIRAHAEATLTRYEDYGISEVDLLAEISTAGDDKVCEFCQELASKDVGYGRGVYKLADARGMIPAHPNCRCSWLPVLDMKNNRVRRARRF